MNTDQQAIVGNLQALLDLAAGYKEAAANVSALMATRACPHLKADSDAVGAYLNAQAFSDALDKIAADIARISEFGEVS